MQPKKHKSGAVLAGRTLLNVMSPLILLAVAAFVIVALRGVGIID